VMFTIVFARRSLGSSKSSWLNIFATVFVMNFEFMKKRVIPAIISRIPWIPFMRITVRKSS